VRRETSRKEESNAAATLQHPLEARYFFGALSGAALVAGAAVSVVGAAVSLPGAAVSFVAACVDGPFGASVAVEEADALLAFGSAFETSGQPVSAKVPMSASAMSDFMGAVPLGCSPRR
jgi:hypothetical protein